MKFHLIDAILEQSADRIVAIKQVSAAEEYLADHFPSFPVLPGVLMLEAMVHAARKLLEGQDGGRRLVLGEVRTLKYGSMVRPGETLEVEVVLREEQPDGRYEFRGTATRRKPAADRSSGETAASGRFTMRPLKLD